MPDLSPIRRALISVSDKSSLPDLARALAARGVELVSTGGSAALLRVEGLAVREVAELTGMEEMLEGRVKTLHPAVHGGLLARRGRADDMATLAAQGIAPIDLLVVNLYPFEATVASGADRAACIENIDIGGPAMIRAAAKNHADVTVVVEPAQYPALLAELAAHEGATTAAFRQRLALAAFGRTSAYDAAVSGWLADQLDEPAPPFRALAGRLAQPLRYGENPHQRAALYRDGSGRPGVATARQVQGKELSYNNIADTDAAFELVADLDPARPAVAIIKHANPCGVATAPTLAGAWQRAFDCDRTSAFGGIVALNRPLDGATAALIREHFTELVIAPDADAEARELLAARRNLRLLLTGAMPDPRAPGLALKPVAGGFLVQEHDSGRLAPEALRQVTRRAPDAAQLADLLFAWRVAKHVKSNAIVLAKDGATVGIGGGQTSRVDAACGAVRKAHEMGAALGLAESPARGAVVASDAFFPFPDALLATVEAGVVAAIQPGGSQNDAAVIAAADEAGLAMLFTGMRHFRH